MTDSNSSSNNNTNFSLERSSFGSLNYYSSYNNEYYYTKYNTETFEVITSNISGSLYFPTPYLEEKSNVFYITLSVKLVNGTELRGMDWFFIDGPIRSPCPPVFE